MINTLWFSLKSKLTNFTLSHGFLKQITINIILCDSPKFSSEHTASFWNTSFRQDLATAFIIFEASLGSVPKWISFPIFEHCNISKDNNLWSSPLVCPLTLLYRNSMLNNFYLKHFWIQCVFMAVLRLKVKLLCSFYILMFTFLPILKIATIGFTWTQGLLI